MVNRYYICDNCNNRFILKQHINDPVRKKCFDCGKMALYQDLTGQHTFVYQEPTTFGHAAERNTERAGPYELEHARSKMPSKKPRPDPPWYNSEGKNLTKELAHLDTEEKQQNYIMKGTA